MSDTILGVLIGAAIGMLASIITTVISHHYLSKRQKEQFIKESEENKKRFVHERDESQKQYLREIAKDKIVAYKYILNELQNFHDGYFEIQHATNPESCGKKIESTTEKINDFTPNFAPHRLFLSEEVEGFLLKQWSQVINISEKKPFIRNVHIPEIIKLLSDTINAILILMKAEIPFADQSLLNPAIFKNNTENKIE